MTEIFMPKAGMDMKEGRLIRWLKEVGDPVEKDEPVNGNTKRIKSTMS